MQALTIFYYTQLQKLAKSGSCTRQESFANSISAQIEAKQF